MSFKQRIDKAKIAEDKFRQYLDDNKINYALSGYENLISSRDFHCLLRQKNDIQSKMIRFYPDYVVVNNKTWLIEVKNSNTIEKEAYDNYLKLSEIGYNVGLVLYRAGGFNFANITDVIIKTVYSKNIPIIDGKWFAPRMMEDDKYFKWKEDHPAASGTTYGIIDLLTTNFRVL